MIREGGRRGTKALDVEAKELRRGRFVAAGFRHAPQKGEGMRAGVNLPNTAVQDLKQ